MAHAWQPCTSSVPPPCRVPPASLQMRRAPAERSTSFLTRARHLSLLCSRSPSPCAQNGAPPPWPGGEACRHRVPAALGSLASYRVRHHLPRRAPPLLLHFSSHRSRRRAVAAGAATGAPPARAAGRPQAASGRAGKPSGCARTLGPSPPLSPPPTSILRPANGGLLRSSFKNREQGPWLRIRV